MSEYDSVLEKLQQMRLFMEQTLGWSSRWSGVLEVDTNLLHAGAKGFDCRIRIRHDIFLDPSFRWRTLLHELLHSFSPAYSPSEYRMFLGWEEGVVEQMQRLFRQRAIQ